MHRASRWLEIAVNGQFGEQRPDHLQRGVDQQKEQRDRDFGFIRPDISEQTPHEAPVVGFP